MNDLEILRSFACEDPPEILRKLFSKSKNAKNEIKDLPLLQIYLNGLSLSGVLVSFDENSRGSSILLGESNSSGSEIVGAAYIQTSDIRAVIVKNYAQFSTLLKRAAALSHAGEIVPSKLALNRIAKELEAEISEKRGLKIQLVIHWDNFSENESSLFHLSDLIRSLKDCLLQISSDNVGKDALLKISSFQIMNSAGKSLSVKKDGSGVLISTDLEEFDFSEFNETIAKKIETLI